MRFLLFLVLCMLVPLSADAQFGPIVPEACRSCACGFGGVLAIVQNVVNFIIGISIIFATFIMVWAGGLYVVSATNPESRSTANKMLLNAVIGIVIVLSAWLIVDFVMKSLYGGQFGPWNSILLGGSGDSCVVAKPTTPLFSGNITAVPGQGTPGGSATAVTSGACANGGTAAACVALAPDVSCAASGCKVDAGLKSALIAAKSQFSGWTVTEAYPPSRTHCAVCHQNGTCVDVGLRPQSYTVENITAFNNAARAAGLRPVLETNDSNQARALQAQGIEVKYYSQVSAPHFSVYGASGSGGSTGGAGCAN